MGRLQAVEDGYQLSLLLTDGLRADGTRLGPIEAIDAGNPSGTHFVFRTLLRTKSEGDLEREKQEYEEFLHHSGWFFGSFLCPKGAIWLRR